MRKNKTKYLVIGAVIVILISISFIGVNLFKSKPKELKEKTISQEETRSMLSYTLDGEKTDIKPTKEAGYIANKIICENGSNLIWDNTNWEVEIISLESNDVCSVDFTTNTSTEGYRITATTNVEGSIDSLNKATIENGTIIFYPNKGQEIIGVSGCTGVLENNKVIVNNITTNQICNIEVKVPLKTLYATLSDGNKYTLGIRTDFSTTFGGSTITQGYNQTKTIYLAENNYYFAGNPSDNWVKFADKWWRIIRTNSTEGTRLLYAGTKPNGQDGYINNTKYVWNSSSSSYYHVYWGNSNFKSTLNTWYNLNITGKNDEMVKVVVYCNDTSYKDMTGTWSGTYSRKYGAYTRLIDAKSPSYTCGANQFGTALKVGMMTADEVAFAGGVFDNNAPNTYYYRNSKNTCTIVGDATCSATGNQSWWTLSPCHVGNGGVSVYMVFGSSDPGNLDLDNVDKSFAVRPVITLLPSVKVTGSGTIDDPFIPSLD